MAVLPLSVETLKDFSGIDRTMCSSFSRFSSGRSSFSQETFSVMLMYFVWLLPFFVGSHNMASLFPGAKDSHEGTFLICLSLSYFTLDTFPFTLPAKLYSFKRIHDNR